MGKIHTFTNVNVDFYKQYLSYSIKWTSFLITISSQFSMKKTVYENEV